VTDNDYRRLLAEEGLSIVSRHNADITDTVQLRDDAMTTTFWLLSGYKLASVV